MLYELQSAVHVVQAEPLESYILAQTPRSRTKSKEHVDLWHQKYNWKQK